MARTFQVGDHVWADFGGGETEVIAHVAGPPAVEGGDVKIPVQHPDGTVRKLTHREPSDRDANGPGGTLWSV